MQTKRITDELVSTHSRPKAAGFGLSAVTYVGLVSTHSRPKAAGRGGNGKRICGIKFQHTAARRRLVDADAACT